MADEELVRMIREQGTDGLKEWGQQNPGEVPDLESAILMGANLESAILREVILRGADLAVADLRGADLWGADLREAILRGANLWEADLAGADLWGAKVTAEQLAEAADLTNAIMPDGTKWEPGGPWDRRGQVEELSLIHI